MDYKNAEKRLKSYLTGKLNAKIERRKLLLRYPPKDSIKKEGVHEVDIKTGGTIRKDKLEMQVIKVSDDSEYNRLKSDYDTIEKFLNHIFRYSRQTHEILYLFYRSGKTWTFISEKVNLSESSCRKKRNEAVQELVDWLEVAEK